ncbi:hypothetical protein RCL1_005281 [Eukaryota sp. TZLM3-RCL]
MRIEEFPQLLSLAGKRAALISTITGNVLQHYVVAGNYNRYLTFAYDGADELIVLNRLLTNEQLKTSSAQTRLLFNSEYNEISRPFGNTTNGHGLHALLLHFTMNVHSFGLREVDISRSSGIVETILGDASPLIEMCLDSVDYYYNYSVDWIRQYSIILLIIFIAFIVLLLFCFFFVFWRMLKQLEQAETITLEFLDMIDDEIVAQVDVIRNFIMSRS